VQLPGNKQQYKNYKDNIVAHKIDHVERWDECSITRGENKEDTDE
jgi:hypothetical protein